MHLINIQVGQIQESIDLLNRKLNEAEMAHQVRLFYQPSQADSIPNHLISV